MTDYLEKLDQLRLCHGCETDRDGGGGGGCAFVAALLATPMLAKREGS
jgi:hypothetical protein